MDISQFTPTDTSFMQLCSPIDEEPLFDTVEGAKAAVGITFHAPGSEAYERAAVRRTNRSLARGKKNTPVTAELMRADAVQFLADVTASFDHLDYPPAAGQEGEDLFKALYADRKYGWVVEQANAHLGDWGNVIKK